MVEKSGNCDKLYGEEYERDGLLVEIILKTIGPARPSRIQVPSIIKIHHLRSLIAENRRLPIEQLKLILRGQILHNTKHGEDVQLHLKEGDSLIVAVKPIPPAKHIGDGFDDDDNEELAWAVIILWFALAPVAYRWDLGPLYILGTGFAIILLNLGQRQHGDLSAYSIFNEDFRELPGTLNADRLDRDIRAGQF
ncbi:hypothetical protein MKW92_039957 [Papaver armeniacum]|nr:hypothetical protein MKW92_039957 [Papaver armeniacum]